MSISLLKLLHEVSGCGLLCGGGERGRDQEGRDLSLNPGSVIS